MNAHIIILYSLLLIINVVALQKRRNSLSIFVISFLILLILMSGNCDNADYAGYLRDYNTSQFSDASSFNKGFVFLMKTFGGLGFTYNQFLIFYFGAFLAPIFIICYKIVKNGHLFIFVYSAYLLFWDVVQIRFFAAESLLLIAFALLALKKRLLFCVSIFVGSLFHISLIPFILLVFYSKKRRYMTVLYIFFMAMVLICIATFLNNNSIPFIDILVYRIFPESLSEKYVYFVDTHTRLGFLAAFLCYFLVLLISHISNIYYKKATNNSVSLPYDDFKTRFCNIVFCGIVFSSFSLPLNMMNSNFIRFVRILIVPLLICVCLSLSANKNNQSKKTFPLFGNEFDFSFYKVLLAVTFVAWISLMTDFKQIVAILSNNLWIV